MLNFLATCNAEFGNCCSDPALVPILVVVKNLLNLIQIIVPLLLLVGATWHLIRLMQNPEEKKGLSKVKNSFLAAGIIFFIPMLVDVVLNMAGNGGIGGCWQNAKSSGLGKTGTYIYTSEDQKNRKSLFTNSDSYEAGVKKPSYSDYEGGVDNSSPNAVGYGAQRMINVALGELGNHEGDKSHHKYEAFTGMDDSQPWCAAFVTWVAGAAGYLKDGMFPRYVGCTTGLRLFKTKTNADVHYANTGYTPQPGDIIFFSWKADGSANHTGIVLSAGANYVYTVEGNTKCEGEAKAKCAGTDGVSKKKRPRDKTILAYATPKYA